MENTRMLRVFVKSMLVVFPLVVAVALTLAGCSLFNVPVTRVTVSPTTASIDVGETYQLTAAVQPSNATNETVTWSTSNVDFATVSSSGLVSGVAEGSATITVETADGGKTATCAVTVTPAWTTVFFDNFNRADTTGREIGSDWTIIGSGTDEMTIAGNKAHSSFTTSSGPGVIAVYNGTIDYSKPLRVSVKGMINVGGPDSPAEFLGLEINTQTTSSYEGYYATLVHESVGDHLFLKLARTDGTSDVTPPNPALYEVTGSVDPGTWYVFEMESSGATVTARLKDATGTTTLGTVSITDSTPLSGGKVLFYNYIVDDMQAPMAGYSADFDDFKIESHQ